MPNYVTNQLTICAEGEHLQKVLDEIKFDGEKRGSFDFNKVIPMPKSLEVESGSLTGVAISAYLDKLRESDSPALEEELKVVSSMGRYRSSHMTEERMANALKNSGMAKDELIALGKRYVDNQREYGAPTWFEWRTKNWGTKWELEPEDTRMSGSTLEFDTAWSPPEPIVEALSQRFPDIVFTMRWASEDIGYNVGERTYEAGKVTDEHIPEPGSSEACGMACDIMQVRPDDVFLTVDLRDEPEGGSADLDKAIEEAKQRAAEANKDAGKEGKPHPAKDSHHPEL